MFIRGVGFAAPHNFSSIIPTIFSLKRIYSVEDVFFFAAKFVQILLELVSIAMIVRMLLPFFTNPEDSKLYLFATMISEPFVAPVRALMVKFNIGQNSPIDWSFFTAYLLLSLLQLFLPSI